MNNKVTWTPGQIQPLWDQLEAKPTAQLGADQGVSASTDVSNSLIAASVDICQCGLHHQQQYCPLVISSKLDDNWELLIVCADLRLVNAHKSYLSLFCCISVSV